MSRKFVINSDSEEEDRAPPIAPKPRIIVSSSASAPSSPTTEPSSQITVKDALNEYFKLKSVFDASVKSLMKKNTYNLTRREKRAHYQKLMHKCVLCRAPSKVGTFFSRTYVPETDDAGAYRILKATCGNLVSPCGLNIEIHLGNYDPMDVLMEQIQREIDEYKNKIIEDKNKLLFGLITTDTVLENFDFYKKYIDEMTTLYQIYLDKWNRTVENPERKEERKRLQTVAEENIQLIQKCMTQLRETGQMTYAEDAVRIYSTTLAPILEQIRQLKYGVNKVIKTEGDECHLEQLSYSPDDINVSSVADKVVHFQTEQSSIPLSKPTAKAETHASLQPQLGEAVPSGKIPLAEPIIGRGDDGVEWNDPLYAELWKKLPAKLKTELKPNVEWMKDFMHQCVNARQNKTGCELVAPPNLKVPPILSETTGKYDFGVSIYNEVFNKQSDSLKSTYLSLFKEDPQTKAKNYDQLIRALNDLVAKEVGFGRGYF